MIPYRTESVRFFCAYELSNYVNFKDPNATDISSSWGDLNPELQALATTLLKRFWSLWGMLPRVCVEVLGDFGVDYIQD